MEGSQGGWGGGVQWLLGQAMGLMWVQHLEGLPAAVSRVSVVPTSGVDRVDESQGVRGPVQWLLGQVMDLMWVQHLEGLRAMVNRIGCAGLDG